MGPIWQPLWVWGWEINQYQNGWISAWAWELLFLLTLLLSLKISFCLTNFLQLIGGWSWVSGRAGLHSFSLFCLPYALFGSWNGSSGTMYNTGDSCTPTLCVLCNLMKIESSRLPPPPCVRVLMQRRVPWGTLGSDYSFTLVASTSVCVTPRSLVTATVSIWFIHVYTAAIAM